ncbi:MAG: hypothetical protein JNJ59_09530 [Deltaproteobacteria bacterium]|nr:hypothetical protein [Deltaproteobacteria bacterium]
MKDIQYSHHAETVALRVAGKTRADSWSAYSWRLVRVGCEVGVAEHRILTRGPNKGRRRWEKAGQLTVVTNEEVHAEAERYEREERRCALCLGEKHEFKRVSQNGTEYKTCRRCNGTGAPPGEPALPDEVPSAEQADLFGGAP